jgi:hypothetical protein
LKIWFPHRSEAIHSYVAASPLWRQTCGAVATRNGVARCEAALAKRAGDAAARRVASPRARAALRALADAGVELRVLRCHANLAARGLPPRLWGRHRDFAGRGVGAVDARDLAAFRGFVRRHEPCVVRGAADVEHRFDSGVQWADLGDDAYLAKRCGHRAVGVRGAYVDGGGAAAGRVFAGAGKGRDIPKGSYLGRFPLVLADFWTSDHPLERPRSVDAFSGTRARGILTLKRR